MRAEKVASRVDRAVAVAFEAFAAIVGRGQTPAAAAADVAHAFHAAADEREDGGRQVMPKELLGVYKIHASNAEDHKEADAVLAKYLDLIRELHHAAVTKPEIRQFMAARAELYGPTEA